jgi:hypothetical protein
MSDDFARATRQLVLRALVVSSMVSGTGAAQVALPGGPGVASSLPMAAPQRVAGPGQGATAATRRKSRIALLAARWDSISRATATAKDVRYASSTTDTLEAGVFRIRTSAALRRRVVPAALDASRELQFTLDASSISAIRESDVFVVRYLEGDTTWHRESLFAGARLAKAYCCAIASVSRFRPDPLREALRELAVNAVSQSFDGELQEWLLQSPLPLLAEPTRPERDARIELGTTASYQARACLGGSYHACSLLLDLRGHPTDPLVTWYSPEDYRALAERVRLAPTDGRDAPRQQRDCLAGATNVCDTLLRSLDRSRIPSPTLQGPRLSLLRHAFRLGGSGALQRLRATPGDIGTRLAAASRTDERRLIESWRSAMTDRATASVRPTAPNAMASFCWVVALAGLGLRRTKRCR